MFNFILFYGGDAKVDKKKGKRKKGHTRNSQALCIYKG